MVRLRRRHLLAVLVIVAALATAFLRKNESAVPEQPTSPVLTKDAEVPHEIELEQSAELLRATKARNSVD